MITRRIPIRNVSSENLTVHVEPWGEQHVLTTDESLELVYYGPSGGKPEIDIGNGEVFVHGWQESRVFVLRNNLCVSQPTLLKIIERVARSEGLEMSRLKLEPDIIDYAQYVLDTAESWNAAGREAAFNAVQKVAPLFSNLENDQFVWSFCQAVLHSRGVFLYEDDQKYNLFFQTLRDTGDLSAVLANWYKEAAMDKDLVGPIEAT